MAIFNGTNANESITPGAVSGTVFVVPAGAVPTAAGDIITAGGGNDVIDGAGGLDIVSGGADRKVVVWNRDGGRIREHAEAGADIWSLAISPNSRWLASVSRDGRVRLYDLTDGTLVRTIPPARKAGTP